MDHTQKTSIDGVFAAGDVCDKTLRQVVTAVADGAVAATSMERALSAKWKANPNKVAANAKAQTQQKPSDCDALSDESRGGSNISKNRWFCRSNPIIPRSPRRQFVSCRRSARFLSCSAAASFLRKKTAHSTLPFPSAVQTVFR